MMYGLPAVVVIVPPKVAVIVIVIVTAPAPAPVLVLVIVMVLVAETRLVLVAANQGEKIKNIYLCVMHIHRWIYITIILNSIY